MNFFWCVWPKFKGKNVRGETYIHLNEVINLDQVVSFYCNEFSYDEDGINPEFNIEFRMVTGITLSWKFNNKEDRDNVVASLSLMNSNRGKQ